MFDAIISRVLANEGGYTNNPNDPGGETNFGISKRAYPQLNIATISRADAVEIYRRDFWVRIHGDELPQAVAYQALDAAVNHGIDTTVRMLQRALGVADDGHFGPVTLAAVAHADSRDVVLNFNAERLDFYARLSTFAAFGRGWTRRIASNLRLASTDN